MPVQIIITLDGDDTLESTLRKAGLVPRPVAVFGGMPGPDGGFSDAEDADADQGALFDTSCVENRGQPEPTPADTAAEEQANKRKRRTKAEMEAARAAEAAAEARAADPGDAVEMAPRMFIVSRYDGRTDTEHTDSGVATERLCDLIANAGEEIALVDLLKANAGLFAVLPSERQAEVNEAIDNARGAWTPAVPAPLSVVAALGIAYPFKDAEGKVPARDPNGALLDVSGMPLLSVTPDRAGAQNCIRVLASTGPGFAQARALLDKYGVERLSALAPDDAKHALVAAEAAAVLGLAMAQPAGGLI